MDSGGNGELGHENRGGGLLNFSSMGNFAHLPSDKVLGMNVGTEPLYKHWNGVYSSTISGWASPIASHVQSDNSSYTDILQNQGTSSTQFQSDCSLAGLEANLPCFGSGSFSEMDNFCIQQTWHRIANYADSADCTQEGNGNGIEKVLNSQNAADNYPHIREECKFLVEATTETSSGGKKRKRDIWSQSAQVKNIETDQVKEECNGEKYVEKRKPERKLAAKQVKDSSTSGDAPKEDTVHARAKRGQATNSHSLAERVRRGKIRERMKFLQDLVPGCSKITGKAIMLDEIINYVLSLQRQVEFLSMKLATVHPEVNVDPEQILLRDIDHSQGVSVAILGDPGMTSYPKEMLQGVLLATQTSNLETPIMPNVASIWDNELDNTSQMGLNPHLPPHNPDSSGCGEVEV